MQNPEPERYQVQLQDKVAAAKKIFAHLNPPEPDVFSSRPLYYRMRAEFRIWHEEDSCFHIMFKKGQSTAFERIDAFPVACRRINQLMAEIMPHINQQNVLKRKLFQIDYLTGKSGDAVVSMLYHKKLDEDWQHQARLLSDHLGAGIIGRARKQKLIIGQDFISETLDVDGRTWHYQQIENAFSQPNAGINENMLNWVRQLTKNSTHDLLELYCGNGNFTCVLADNFKKVLATEVSKSAVNSARFNLNANSIFNTEVIRMSSEDFTQALDRVRPFRRLKSINLDHYDFGSLLVDPPRVGLDSQTLQLASRFNRIIYISCNPLTLLENINSLSRSHRIKHFAIFDQFPYTPHVECAMILDKVLLNITSAPV